MSNFDITKKRALETGTIELVNGDGSPLYDDNANVLSVTVHGPASKRWQQADSERNRRRAERMQRNPRNSIAAAIDHAREDDIAFLCAVTISFNGWTYPHPEAANGGTWATAHDMFKAAYSDDSIGYIRDHVVKESGDWAAFTKGSQGS